MAVERLFVVGNLFVANLLCFRTARCEGGLCREIQFLCVLEGSQGGVGVGIAQMLAFAAAFFVLLLLPSLLLFQMDSDHGSYPEISLPI